MAFNPKTGTPLRVVFMCLVAFMGVGTISCAEKAKKLRSRELTIERAAGSNVRLEAEIALSDAEKGRGFMFRKEVPDGWGMLFVFDTDQHLSFWMKNTIVPLSVAYISSDGRILEIHDMTPQSLAPVVSGRSARYALEVPVGWFGRMGVGLGDILVIPSDL